MGLSLILVQLYFYSWVLVSFSDRNLSLSVVVFSHFRLLLQNHTANFNQTQSKEHPWVNGIQICTNKGNSKKTLRNSKMFFSIPTEPISTKLSSKNPLVKRNQVYSNEGPYPYPGGDNNQIMKIHWLNLKIFSTTTSPISTKLCTEHSWVKGITGYLNEGPPCNRSA